MIQEINKICYLCNKPHGWKYHSGNDWYSKEDQSDFGTRDYKCKNCGKLINPSISPKDWKYMKNIRLKTEKVDQKDKELKIRNIYTATALISYGIKFICIKEDIDGSYFSFENSFNAQNILTLYNRQYEFLLIELEKRKHFIGKKIAADKNQFGDIKEVFKESTKKIRGAARKSNGVWKG